MFYRIKASDKFIYVFSFFSALIVIVFRDILSSDNLFDLSEQIQYFNETKSIRFYDDISGGYDPSFFVISFLVKKMGFDYHGMFLVYAFPTLFLVYKSIIKYSQYVGLSFLVYFSYFFLLHGCTQIRAGLSIAIFLASIDSLYKREKKYFVFCLFAFLAHSSGLLMLPLYFMKVDAINKKICYLILGGSIMFSIVGTFGMEYIISMIPIPFVQIKVQGYFLYADVADFTLGAFLGIIFKVIMAGYLLFNIEKVQTQFKYIFVKIYIWGLTAFFILSVMPSVSGRVFEYYEAIELFALPCLVDCVRISYRGLIKFFVILYCSLIFVVKTKALLNV